MRSLTRKHRLSGLSIPEITKGFRDVVLRQEDRLKFCGTQLWPGPALNALVLHFLALPEATQDQILAESLARLESILAGTATLSGSSPPAPAEPGPTRPRVPHSDFSAEPPPPPSTARPRKKGS